MADEKLSKKNSQTIDTEYRHYRQAGLTLSASIILFSMALLSWSLSKYKGPSSASWIFYFQAISLLFSIGSAFFIQYSHYMGYQNQARMKLPQEDTEDATTEDATKEKKKKADNHFNRADNSVLFGCLCLILGTIVSIALWFCQKG